MSRLSTKTFGEEDLLVVPSIICMTTCCFPPCTDCSAWRRGLHNNIRSKKFCVNPTGHTVHDPRSFYVQSSRPRLINRLPVTVPVDQLPIIKKPKISPCRSFLHWLIDGSIYDRARALTSPKFRHHTRSTGFSNAHACVFERLIIG